MPLVWTNPQNVDVRPRVGFVYYIRIEDPQTGLEYRYVGKSTTGTSRLRAYARNVQRIREGLPRRTTVGQERYRAVHLALAKALEAGWVCEFFPLENAPLAELNARELELITTLKCNLNVRRSWLVADYGALDLAEFLDGQIGRTTRLEGRRAGEQEL